MATAARVGIWITLAAVAISVTQAQQTFYVSPAGDDSNNGLSPGAPWRTVEKVNTASPGFDPGTVVRFQRGGQWRERLAPMCSGTENAPIIFEAYGNGAKPIFWGSDVLQSHLFTFVSGTASTYQISVATAVHSVFRNHNFLRSAYLISGSSNAQVLRETVDATPNSWAWVQGVLYVNTGGSHPSAGGALWTATVRDDVVLAMFQDHLVFRDLVVDESAREDAGYAFRVQFSEHVRLEDCEAYRAGKHHFGVINSGNFVGTRLVAAGGALPDQGFGGATYLVSYSDGSRVGDDHQWIDCRVENQTHGYFGFYAHGEGLGSVLVQNAEMINADLSADVPGLEVRGGYFEGVESSRSIISVGSSGCRIEGVRMQGWTGIHLRGAGGHLVQNALLEDTVAVEYGAIQVSSPNCIVRLNTVLTADHPDAAGVIQIDGGAAGADIYGNLFRPNAHRAAVRQFGSAEFTMDRNVYHSPNVGVTFQLGNAGQISAEAWRQLGRDEGSFFGDADLAGKFALRPTSPAVEWLEAHDVSDSPGGDFTGEARLVGDRYDAGAVELQFPYHRWDAQGNFMFGHRLLPHRTYRVQHSVDLTRWTDLGPALNRPGSPDYHFTDTEHAPVDPAGFYRMVESAP